MDYASTREIIHKSEFLSDDDSAFLEANITAIQDNWEKRQVFRTETEMRISVLNDLKFPTPASKYWQAVREQSVFYEQLVQASFDYRRNKIKQAKLVKQIEQCEDELDRELLQIDLEELQFGQLNIEQVAQDRIRELRLWSQIMQEQIEADPDFDANDPNTHQLVSYGLRFQSQMDNVVNGTPGEKNNLMGQYNSAMKELQRKGMLTSIGKDKNGNERFILEPKPKVRAIK